MGAVGTVFEAKENSMKWFGNLLLKIIQKSQRDEDVSISLGAISTAKLRRDNDIDSDEGLNITVRKAIGGKIITFRHYDTKHDRNVWKNYVIPDDLDFERELGKMITLESMR